MIYIYTLSLIFALFLSIYYCTLTVLLVSNAPIINTVHIIDSNIGSSIGIYQAEILGARPVPPDDGGRGRSNQSIKISK